VLKIVETFCMLLPVSSVHYQNASITTTFQSFLRFVNSLASLHDHPFFTAATCSVGIWSSFGIRVRFIESHLVSFSLVTLFHQFLFSDYKEQPYCIKLNNPTDSHPALPHSHLSLTQQTSLLDASVSRRPLTYSHLNFSRYIPSYRQRFLSIR
jgi:hypothetical protein